MILVFGAGGQVGQELAAMAARKAVPLTGIDRRQVDITDHEAVVRVIGQVRPAVVVNAAAYNAVDKAEIEPSAAMQVNAEGPGIIASACDAAGMPMVHVSTDFVFDGNQQGAYREDDPVAPLGAYGRSKAAGEEAVRSVCPRHIIIRTAWLFGVCGSNFLKTVLRLAREQDTLDVVADQRASPTATTDLARAILAIAAGDNASWGTYHFAGPTAATRHEFASRVVAAQTAFTGRAPPVKPITDKAFGATARRPANSVLDSSKFTATFGVRAGPWEAAVDRTVAALLAPRATA